MIRLKSREALRERLRLELANCVKCGACMAFCPVYRVERTETANMRGRLALLQSIEAGRKIPADAVEAALGMCAGCLTCRATCPNKVETGLATTIGRALHADASPKTRARRWFRRLVSRHPVGRRLLALLDIPEPSTRPDGKTAGTILGMLKRAVRKSREYSPEQPAVDSFETNRIDVLLVPGCRLSAKQNEILFTIKLCEQAGLGTAVAPDIGCCGLPALTDGDLDGYAESVRLLFEEIDRRSPKRILFLCPECWYAWRMIPELCDLTEAAKAIWKNGDEFLAVLSKTAWQPGHRMENRVVFHEACLYARGGGDRQAPFRLLERMVSTKPVNAARDGSCCGAGGGLVRTAPGVANRIAFDRIEELCRLGPDTVVTHCGRCRDVFADSLRSHGIRTVTFLELLDEANR